MTSTLRRWLADRTEEDLAGILERRPDVYVSMPPRSLADLAERLHYPHSLRNVVVELPLPCVELISTLLVYGHDGISLGDLATILRVAPDDATLVHALRVCLQRAVVWETDGMLHTSGSLRSVLGFPLKLGPPVIDLLTPRTVDELTRRADALGLSAPRRKTALLDALGRHYADGDLIRALVAKAPTKQREMVTTAAWTHPVLPHEMVYMYPPRPDPAVSYLLDTGLAIGDWQALMVPREVALAIRGADWHPPLSPMPVVAVPGETGDTPAGVTRVAAVAVRVEDADRDAAAAANAAIERVATVVEICGTAPVTLLKSGGVGVRELRRIAKEARLDGADGDEVRLWIELGYAAGLLDVEDDSLLPTPAFDVWLAQHPAARLVSLLRAWLALPSIPLLVGQPARPALAVTNPGHIGVPGAQLRGDVLAAAVEWPPGTGITDIADLHTVVRWRRPVVAIVLSDPADAIDPTWAEARLLGIVGRDTLSTLGRALADDDSSLDDVAVGFVHAPTTEAIFQADLTVVVAGNPAPDVAALLDTAADRESRGAASTWRLSPASVRRALDGGATADGLRAALRAIAAGGTLPQPLEYLLTDVARRHGTLRVRTVGCVVRANDVAMLAEIAAVRSLAPLHLSLLAPNVLASAAPVETTLAALRAAGYAPVGEDTTGAPLVERVPKRRAGMDAPSVPVRPRRHPDDPAGDPRVIAERLLRSEAAVAAAIARSEAESAKRSAAEKAVRAQVRQALGVLPETPQKRARPPAAPVAPRPPAGVLPPDLETVATIRHYAGHLSPKERTILADAINGENDVWIRYTGADGRQTQRVIAPIELDDDRLIAWCHLRDDERNFVLARIEAVRTI